MPNVDRTTKLSKMMAAYCERAGKAVGDVRFMFGSFIVLRSSFPCLLSCTTHVDGNKVLGTQTVEDVTHPPLHRLVVVKLTRHAQLDIDDDEEEIQIEVTQEAVSPFSLFRNAKLMNRNPITGRWKLIVEHPFVVIFYFITLHPPSLSLCLSFSLALDSKRGRRELSKLHTQTTKDSNYNVSNDTTHITKSLASTRLNDRRERRGDQPLVVEEVLSISAEVRGLNPPTPTPPTPTAPPIVVVEISLEKVKGIA